MNIFVTDECPIESARYLDDKRVVKMVLESAQMLSTAAIYHKSPELFEKSSKEARSELAKIANSLGIYKPTHPNHPCSIWVRTTRKNYEWLYSHFEALCQEYTHRYGKRHKCSQIGNTLLSEAKSIPMGELTPFANCAAHSQLGISYKHLDDVHLAYKLYLGDRWETDKRQPTWYKVAR